MAQTIERGCMIWAQRFYNTITTNTTDSQLSYTSWEVIPLLDDERRNASLRRTPKSIINRGRCQQSKALTTTTATTEATTATTATTTQHHVCFEQPIVTCVRYLPRMLPEERTDLFYSRRERRKFMEAYRNHRVRFIDSFVSETRLVPKPNVEELGKLFYTKEEIRRFLEDYVELLTANEKRRHNVLLRWAYVVESFFTNDDDNTSSSSSWSWESFKKWGVSFKVVLANQWTTWPRTVATVLLSSLNKMPKLLLLENVC